MAEHPTQADDLRAYAASLRERRNELIRRLGDATEGDHRIAFLLGGLTGVTDLMLETIDNALACTEDDGEGEFVPLVPQTEPDDLAEKLADVREATKIFLLLSPANQEKLEALQIAYGIPKIAALNVAVSNEYDTKIANLADAEG